MNLGTFLRKKAVSGELSRLVDSMPLSVGSLGYDPWGFNTEDAKVGLTVLKWFFDNYFRVTVHGLENVPTTGPLLVIPNHAGQLPTDGMMIGVALATNPDGPRAARAMVERFAFHLPFVGNTLNRVGAVVGDPVNCIRMLNRGEAVIVFPEGARGGGKVWAKRYQLQGFGNGFMHMALETGATIVPVGVVGSEETMPALVNLKPLAKILGWPSFPLTIPFPLPARFIINFGEPMRFSGDVESEEDVAKMVQQVKDEVRRLVDKGLAERKSIY